MNNIAGSLNLVNVQQREFSGNAVAPSAGNLQNAININNQAKANSDITSASSDFANGTQNRGSVKSAVKSAVTPAAGVNKNLQAVLKAEIKESLNPTFALSTLTLFKWDPKAGGTVIDIVNSKTGKVESQIPSEEFIKYMQSHYRKGFLLNEKL
jgi:uncharacterized FlaG/YvyC family protein